MGTITDRSLHYHLQSRLQLLWIPRLEVIKISKRLRHNIDVLLELTGTDMAVHRVEDDGRPRALVSWGFV